MRRMTRLFSQGIAFWGRDDYICIICMRYNFLRR